MQIKTGQTWQSKNVSGLVLTVKRVDRKHRGGTVFATNNDNDKVVEYVLSTFADYYELVGEEFKIIHKNMFVVTIVERVNSAEEWVHVINRHAYNSNTYEVIGVAFMNGSLPRDIQINSALWNQLKKKYPTL